MDEDMDLNEMPEGSFNAADMGADDAAYAPHKEGEEKDLTPDGGVKKLLVKAGEGWDKPETGDEVHVHYTGTLLDGTKFDSSVDRNEPFTFKLGQGNVIKGWDKGVATMKKNEKCVLTITAPYAYGDAGSPPTIPGGATLKFEVELLSWKSIKDICGDGGIIKTLVSEGKKWESPKPDDEVKIEYEVKLQNGTVVDKSPEEGVQYKLKDGHLCPAIGEVLKTMHKGEEVSLDVKPRYGFGDKGRETKGAYPAIPPNSTLGISLKLSGWISVEKVTDDWKVKKKALKEGEGYEKPNEMAKVKVRYTAKLANGTVFEKKGQEIGQEFEFVIDEEHVIPGLDKAVLKMKKGETALVSIAAEYGYGAQEHKGELAVVPPNSDLEYEVELVSFEKAKESWDMDSAEKLEAAGKRKEEGNVLFKLGKYERASKKYAKGVKLIEYDSQFSDEEKKQSKVLQVSCNLNDAACQLKLINHKEAEKLCTKVLEKESQNVKALFRRAQAYIGSQDYEEAGVDIKKALEIDPNNRDVKVEQKKLRQKVADANKKEAKIYGNMFARLSKMEEKETTTTDTYGHAKLEEVEEEKVEPPSEPMVVEETKL